MTPDRSGPSHQPHDDDDDTHTPIKQQSQAASARAPADGSWGTVVVVLLCWGAHHVLHAVKREYCRRVTPEELESMLALWMVGGWVGRWDGMGCSGW